MANSNTVLSVDLPEARKRLTRKRSLHHRAPSIPYGAVAKALHLVIAVLGRKAAMKSVATDRAGRWARTAAALAFIIAPALPATIIGAASATYEIDPNHTHPAFEVDHFGMSMWRGLFRTTHGTVTLDVTAGSGTVDVIVEVASVDFGNDKLNDITANATAPAILEAAKYPTAQYTGTLGGFINGAPTTVTGYLTLHGVTEPLALTIRTFRCIPDHPVVKREVCGADAIGTFNRADFGITVGQQYGFKMDVTLRIQVEAIRTGAVTGP